MIRNNNDIRGIIIDNKEYKISQYADDTQLFLNGSENSLRDTLDVLQKFSNSPTRLCHNYTLDWPQGLFKILDVTFSTKIHNIWDLNSIDIIKKVEGVCKQWSKRKLTLIGRITILKSLALLLIT